MRYSHFSSSFSPTAGFSLREKLRDRGLAIVQIASLSEVGRTVISTGVPGIGDRAGSRRSFNREDEEGRALAGPGRTKRLMEP